LRESEVGKREGDRIEKDHKPGLEIWSAEEQLRYLLECWPEASKERTYLIISKTSSGLFV